MSNYGYVIIEEGFDLSPVGRQRPWRKTYSLLPPLDSLPPGRYELVKVPDESHPAPSPIGTPCKIMEYDGAYKCAVHGRTWGAVPKPDEPCEGWVPR